MNSDRIAGHWRQFKGIGVTLVASALAMLSGCVAVPAGPGYYAGSPGYAYDAPAPAYYGSPVYYGPSVGIEISGGRSGYGRSYHRGYGYR